MSAKQTDREIFILEADLETFVIVVVPAHLDFTKLTDSELHVARLVLDGWANAQIANSRGVSTRTVVNQLKAIYTKLGVHSRRELKAAFTNC